MAHRCIANYLFLVRWLNPVCLFHGHSTVLSIFVDIGQSSMPLLDIVQLLSRFVGCVELKTILCPKNTHKNHNFQKWVFQCQKGPISIYMSHFHAVLTIRAKLVPYNRVQNRLSDIHVFGHRTVLNRALVDIVHF